MKFGVVFPQIEIGNNPDDIVDFAQAVEDEGYSHLLTFDHVLGANTASRPDWSGPYSADDTFYEPFVLFSFLTPIVKRIEFVSGILILPQRQTALVAKQAACLDILSEGRLRLGIGTGWNPVEYEALNENFHNRGKRSEEQIEVMRKPWSEHTFTYRGKWHTITDAGINPRPPHGSIPVWLGGTAPKVIQRVGKLADGWFPFYTGDLEDNVAKMRDAARSYGRDPAEIGVECMQPITGTPNP